MQARHFRIHLGSSHLPGHFISSLGRVMHVPKLCKMYNQAFEYTPCEQTMSMHMYVLVHAYCTCGLYCIVAQSYTHRHTNRLLPLNLRVLLLHPYTVNTTRSLLQYSHQLHCNCHLCNVKEPSVVYYSKSYCGCRALCGRSLKESDLDRYAMKEGSSSNLHITIPPSFHLSFLLCCALSRCRPQLGSWDIFYSKSTEGMPLRKNK